MAGQDRGFCCCCIPVCCVLALISLLLLAAAPAAPLTRSLYAAAATRLPATTIPHRYGSIGATASDEVVLKTGKLASTTALGSDAKQHRRSATVDDAPLLDGIALAVFVTAPLAAVLAMHAQLRRRPSLAATEVELLSLQHG
eukprot:EG_transcript_20051